jgi:hypothetical protein
MENHLELETMEKVNPLNSIAVDLVENNSLLNSQVDNDLASNQTSSELRLRKGLIIHPEGCDIGEAEGCLPWKEI